jgi:aminoglycoside phosphotransferase (APT) family kinase protein
LVTDFEAQVRQFALAAWPDFGWSQAEVRVGAFHTVAIPPDGPVLRLTTGSHFRRRAQREARTLQILTGIVLPVPIPRVLAGPVDSAHWSATLITRVPGAQAGDISRTSHQRTEAYAALLAALEATGTSALSSLPVPRTWCGGAEWPAIGQDDLIPLLDQDARRPALTRVWELLQVEDPGARVLCHGDFGPHNILWHQDRAAGLIDLDHACLGDPAIDLAPLIGFHGLQAIRPMARSGALKRAMFHRATLPLQVAAAAHLNGSYELRDHALRNFTARNGSGTLFDPTGFTPADLPGNPAR